MAQLGLLNVNNELSSCCLQGTQGNGPFVANSTLLSVCFGDELDPTLDPVLRAEGMPWEREAELL